MIVDFMGVLKVPDKLILRVINFLAYWPYRYTLIFTPAYY